MRTVKNLLLLLLLSSFTTGALAQPEEEELLEPEKAFEFSLTAKNADTLVAEYSIAPGYYLYRDRISFRVQDEGVSLGDYTVPAGKKKQDEFFGEVEIHKHSVSTELKLRGDALAGREITIESTAQGCAEVGVCYPPVTQTASLTLPAGAASARDEALSAINRLGGMLGLQDEVLDPEQAFIPTVTAEADRLQVHFDIADGHYLYRDKLSFNLQDARGVQLGQFELPPGKEKQDEFFGLIRIFKQELNAELPLVRQQTDAQTVSLVMGYQGCSEAGICYPPQTQSFDLSLPAAGAVAAAAEPRQAPAAPQSEQDRIAATLAEGSFWLVLLTFLGFGLLLAFTPCVFPMIPILSGIIAGQGAGLTTRKAFVLSLVYVLAMSLTYTIAGVLAGLFGSNIQAAFQNPWIIAAFAAIFVALALSMFGFYELQLPNALQSRLTEVSNKQKGGSLVGVAAMGLLSALIVGPCVAPPLAGALIYIGQTGDALLGGAALFAMSMGMGLPLVAIGTSAGKFLPRAGAWMDTVKAVFGVIMLGVAVWMLSRILPETATLALWALLLIVSAIYMGALDRLGEESPGWSRLWKGLGIALLAWGILMLIGVAAGSKSPTQPLKSLTFGGGTEATEQEGLAFQTIKSVEDLERELAAGRPVMLDFYADWCVSCKELEHYTFTDPRVKQAVSDVILLQADVTANDAQDKALMKRFGIIGPPAILFFGPDGQERREFRVVGFQPAEEFAPHAARALQP